MVAIRLPQCNHIILVYLDTNMNPRCVQSINDPRISVEYLKSGLDNLLIREKELLDSHAAAIDLKDQARTEETWQKLKQVRHEIILAGLD
jgi:hypothetical protein